MPESSHLPSERAKAYQRTRNWLTLAGLGLTLGAFMVLFACHFERSWFAISSQVVVNQYGQLSVFFLMFSLYFLLFQAPLGFYSSYVLEHQYELSNQSLRTWFRDFLKKELLSFGISLLLILGLYAIIWQDPFRWWWWTWIGYTLVSVVLGQLFPVLVVPLFYKYRPIEDGELKSRILALAKQFGLRIDNVYSLNLSRTTKKANAMFCGIGKTKRVVLADTLLDHFTPDEIEVVTAHEVGHFRHKDIWRQLALMTVISFAIFWFAGFWLRRHIPDFGYDGGADAQLLPWILFIFYLPGIFLSPLTNAYSRHRERKADEFALRVLKKPGAFISAMEKLGRMNLADPNPHPLIELILYDHPSIQKRIAFAERFSA